MPRTLLLCFIHGFKGNDNTFQKFPEDLKAAVSKSLPEGDDVQAVVYPKYETKGELAQCAEAFLEWLKERVVELRKERSEKPWPPGDRDVGVVLVSHSMGGFVASDALFLVLDERRNSETTTAEGENTDTKPPLFPLIQGVLAFDTPYNGLARSMFVYGAFSNYNKVSSVFNVMTALAAAPAGLSKLAMQRATKAASSISRTGTARAVRRSTVGWKAWQLMAVRTGTVGAIAAGGVAAYVHRKEIAAGLRSVRDLDRSTIAESYQRGVTTLGQGLAYINRGNVGRSYQWLAEHFTFVGALLKPRELERRLARLAALKGVGVRDVYASLGENGYWSGGYFVPERTFCAVPGQDATEGHLFGRRVVEGAVDEVDAHMTMFQPEKNKGYDDMTEEAARTVLGWFNSDEELFDDPKFAQVEPAEAEESKEEDKITATDEGIAVGDDIEAVAAATEKVADDSSEPTRGEKRKAEGEPDSGSDDGGLPDESPIDIAAAASLVPLPDDRNSTEDGQAEMPNEKERQTYLRHLFGVAEQAGTGLKSYYNTAWSAKLPTMPAMPSMEKMPNLPSIPSMPRPGFGLFSRKQSDPKKDSADDADKEKNGGSDSGAVKDKDVEEKGAGVVEEQRKTETTTDGKEKS
ncbi:hypothetical protein MCOR30_003658 [Pyricularia oryzae]|nr:hypothetical protein MCOR30_003658 [Pyricularia oryzae]KAI6571048.1 hypothetical protein MCOR09_004375 [Pyricularia oryzae]